MKDWLIKYWIALCALFVACLSLYLNLQNWKRQGTNLTALALNIAVTFVMLGILLNRETAALRVDRSGRRPTQKGWQARKPGGQSGSARPIPRGSLARVR